VLTVPQLRKLWSQLNKELVACDSEYSSFNYLEMEVYGLSFCDGEVSFYVDLLSSESLLEELRPRLIEVDNLILHNAPSELKVFQKLGIPHTENIRCTMTMAHLLDENQPKSLKELAERYLRVATTDFEEAVSHGVQSPEFYDYACADAEWTYQLWLMLKSRLGDQALESLFYDIEMPFQYVLRDLEINGVLVDQTNLIREREWLRQRLVEMQRDLYESGGIKYVAGENLLGEPYLESELNLNSSAQLSEFIRNRLGISLVEVSKDGHYSVAKHVLKGIQNQHAFIPKLLEYRAATKLLNSFLEKLPKHVDWDGRVRASFNNCVAVTGRLSSSDPNMQQLPKSGASLVNVRSMIVAPEGYTLIAADYSGQELRVLAEVSRDLTMIKAFIKGQDVHLATANEFFKLGIPDDLLFTSHPGYKEIAAKYKTYRDKAKTINFGIAYGKTAVGFAKDWNVSKEEAQNVVNQYFAQFPRIKEAIKRCARQVDSQGFVTNLAGRRRRLPTSSKRSYRQAFNFLVQGFSADMVKAAGARVNSLRLGHPEWDLRWVLQVHDEYLWECKEGYVDEAMPLIKREMEGAMQICVPLVVDISKGQNYAEAKS
jgi:DNA polymerase-1